MASHVPTITREEFAAHAQPFTVEIHGTKVQYLVNPAMGSGSFGWQPEEQKVFVTIGGKQVKVQMPSIACIGSKKV